MGSGFSRKAMGSGFSREAKFESPAAEAIYIYLQQEGSKIYTGAEKNTVLKPMLAHVCKDLGKLPAGKKQIHFSLQNLALGEAGGVMLCKLIQEHLEIDDLSIVNCQIPDSQMATIYSNLNIPRGMRKLNLSGNGIGELALPKILLAFNGHMGKSIQSLVVGDIPFSEEQLSSFLIRLYSVPKLEYLDISQLKLPSVMYPIIMGALFTNHTLREIKFPPSTDQAFLDRARLHMDRNQVVNEIMDFVIDRALDWNTVLEYRLHAMRKGKTKPSEQDGAHGGPSKHAPAEAKPTIFLPLEPIVPTEQELIPILCDFGHASMQGTRDTMEDEIILCPRLRVCEGSWPTETIMAAMADDGNGIGNGIGNGANIESSGTVAGGNAIGGGSGCGHGGRWQSVAVANGGNGAGAVASGGSGWGQGPGRWWESAFGVFDGHGGRECAVYAARSSGVGVRSLLQAGTEGQTAVAEALLQTERNLLHARVPAGTCALMVHLALGRIHVAGVGDSLLVASDVAPGARAGRCVYQSVRRRPTDPQERRRIEAHGGFVTGNGRLNGVLGVSRALGDAALKPLVSPQPESDTLLWRPATGHTLHLLLACDGVWDVADPAKAAENVTRMGSARSAARKIRNYAKSKGSKDNITVIVLQIHNARFAGSLRAQNA
eukprot:TRINITY_DN4220_c0_g1_i2.p1 TRINITY_DN4220_c0_g1~~TRINITY_DN4220_c0_g1_i2.p1  ORF type:complete len:658 (-),score=88.34 TRINITY_DN4220_c0_g1_i2:398-2371(-)